MAAHRSVLSSLLVWVLVAACGGGATTPPATTTTATRRNEAPALATSGPEAGRLPSDVVPKRYTLALVIDPRAERFTGSVSIRVRLSRPRQVIWLHGKQLDVTEAAVERDGDAVLAADWEVVDAEEGLAKIVLPSAIGPGEATIRVSYSAPFNAQLDGLYAIETGGEKYAFTQFEPLAARLAFPSFDEPCFKTPYDVTLTVREGDVAIANTLAVDEAPSTEGMRRIRFATTEPLPTYLVAWAVGPLDVVEAAAIAPNDVRQRPIPFRGVAPKGRGAELAYALRETPGALAALEAYTGIAYPYDKLDIIAIPDFPAGAMENAGAITFRDTLLLLDERTAPTSQKRGFAYVMAHELAHQWFGNLVTMAWWDDLWLNEAFASWAEHRVMETWHPEYEPSVSLLDWVIETMDADSLASARSIRQPIVSSHDIHNAFDDITYGKGAGVLAMFEAWLGRETFREGLRAYLSANRFGIARSEDLMAALSRVSGRDVATPFQTFLTQPGVPFLETSLVCEQGRAPRVDLTQSRFVPIGSSARMERPWQVPVCVRYLAGQELKQTCGLLADRQGSIELEGDQCPAWVMPNASGAGYYRWSLAPDALRALSFGTSKLDVLERRAFVDAVVAAFESGRTEADDAFRTLTSLAGDRHWSVAVAPIGAFELASEHLVEEAQRAEWNDRMRQTYTPHLRAVGWAPPRGAAEEDGRKILRSKVIAFLALEVEDAQVRREAVRRARAYLGYPRDNRIHENAVDPDLVPAVLTVAAQEADARFFDALVAHVHATEDGVLRRSLLRALGAVRDGALAARARELSLDPRLRANERTHIVSVQLEHEETRETAWAWLREHFEPWSTALPAGWAGWAPNMLTSYCSAERADEVQTFFGPRIESLPGGPRNLAAATESIRLCAALVEAQAPHVATWLRLPILRGAGRASLDVRERPVFARQ